MKRTIVCEKCFKKMFVGWRPKSKKRRIQKKYRQRERHYHFEGTIKEVDTTTIHHVTTHRLRGRTKEGVIFDEPCFNVQLPLIRVGEVNRNGVLFPHLPNGPITDTVLVESEADFLKLFGAPNQVSMGFMPPEEYHPTVVRADGSHVFPCTIEKTLYDDFMAMDITLCPTPKAIADELDAKVYQDVLDCLEKEGVPIPMNIHAERMFAEPCVNCGHPADAHGGPACQYPVYDTEPGRGHEEVVVEGSQRECGCTNFVGVGERNE